MTPVKSFIILAMVVRSLKENIEAERSEISEENINFGFVADDENAVENAVAVANANACAKADASNHRQLKERIALKDFSTKSGNDSSIVLDCTKL
jgi:hypothetical protein